jgi:hypothetical protein
MIRVDSCLGIFVLEVDGDKNLKGALYSTISRYQSTLSAWCYYNVFRIQKFGM